MLLILEGCDGAGKTSAAKVLVDALSQCGYRSEYCREPGGTALGEKLRPLLLDKSLAMTPLAQTALFTASRFQLLESLVPKLDAGMVIVMDRYIYSTVAYQVYAGDVPKAFVAALNAQCDAILRAGGERDTVRHDVFGFNLTVSPEVARQRLVLTGKAPDRFEDRDGEFQAKVRQAYFELEDPFTASSFNCSPLTPVNAEQPLTHVVRSILDVVQVPLAMHPKVAVA